DLLVLRVGRPVAEIPALDLDQAALLSQFQQALPEIAVEDLGEQRQDVEAEGRRHALGCAAWAASAAACSSAFFMYFLKSTAHFSDGSAPTPIQYLMRSGRSFTRLSVSWTCGS